LVFLSGQPANEIKTFSVELSDVASLSIALREAAAQARARLRNQ
jgi:hypothetical protein